MELINNVNKTLRDDLTAELHSGSKLSIAASCFSIYAFQELKAALKDIKELRFIFTSPTFTTERTPKQQREFYIPRLDRERTLYGSEFEVKLRNELTQKAIARECAEWIRQKACFKSNRSNEQMMGFVNLDNTSYAPINGFTTVELGCEKGNTAYTMIQKMEAPFSQAYIETFNQIWNDSSRLQVVTEEVIDSISNAYKENAPEFLYFVALYNIFNEFLKDITEDVLPNEATGFKQSVIWNKLYNFQRDAALAIINKLEKFNGCILADSVGLGKTFTALSVIKYFESRNRSVLVRVPLGWAAGTDMSAMANPLETAKERDMSGKQTVEMRSPDGSADLYQLLAGLCVACRHGFEMNDALELAERTYVNVNIHDAQNADRLSQLAQLPDSCAASADCLEQLRSVFEEQGVFSPAMIDGIIAQLRSYNDRTLRQDIHGNTKEILRLVHQYFHCG